MSREWLRSGSVEQYVEAAPQDVYQHVADVTRTGERSDECHTAEWLPGSEPGTVGARFRGRNKKGWIRWSRVCEVMVAEPGTAFAFRTVPEKIDIRRADSTTWRYDMRPSGTGTTVTHSYEITKLPLKPFMWLYGRILSHHRDMRPAMRVTLERLRAELESAGTPS